MRRLPALLALVLAALLAAGCGNARVPAPDVATPGPPLGFSPREIEAAGLALQVPNGWRIQEGEPPAVLVSSTGTAVIAVWRYPREEPLPSTGEELQAALDNLVDAAQVRDPRLEVRSSDVTEIDGRPAVELIAEGTVRGRPRVLRSVHVYAFGSEYVFDAYTRPEDFERIDEQVIGRLLGSIQLSEPA